MERRFNGFIFTNPISQMNILVNALSGIGDALMFTPSLKLLKEAYPNSEIHALVMFKAVKDFYERNPNISSVIHFDFLSEGFIKSLKFIFLLRGYYDISINVYPSNRKEYNVINYLIRVLHAAYIVKRQHRHPHGVAVFRVSGSGIPFAVKRRATGCG